MEEPVTIFNPLETLEAQLVQAELYLKGIESDYLSLVERALKAKMMRKQARQERDNVKRAIYCLKQAGYK